MKRDTHILLAGSAALIVAVGTIAWWFGSLEGVGKLGQAVMMLTGAICSVVHCRRLSNASPSPLMACGAVLGLGFPFLVRNVGPVFTAVFTLSVVFVWVGIGIARFEQRARLREKQA